MESAELERAIRIYLDVDRNGAVYPVGMEDRIRAKYDDADVVLHEIKKTLSILDEYKPDESAGSDVEADLNRRLPQFSTLLHKAMASYWSYNWWHG